jgi:hypothetical protein
LLVCALYPIAIDLKAPAVDLFPIANPSFAETAAALPIEIPEMQNSSFQWQFRSDRH